MPERIIDFLEPIQIEAVHSQSFAAPDTHERVVNAFMQKCPIGQTRERVM